MEEDGFVVIPNYIDTESIHLLNGEVKDFIKESYNKTNLSSNAAYLSDNSKSRTSHAFMVSQISSDLPTCGVELPLQLKDLHLRVNQLLQGVFCKFIPTSSRFMINFQDYQSSSKVVPWHYDGHYISYEKNENGFRLTEGLLPSHVVVLNLHNENKEGNTGLNLLEVSSGKVIAPSCDPGSLIIFDNLRFRHSVPELAKPRAIIGFRNFDVNTYHFKSDSGEVKLPDADSPGYVTPLTFTESTSLLSDYYKNQWPGHLKEILKEGAVF